MSGGLADPPASSDAWIRINTAALRANASALRELLGTSSNTQLLAVVKANGYGHGAAAALQFRQAGAGWFGVTTLDEALELCNAGINSAETPILVFAPLVTPEQVDLALFHSLHLTVCDLDHVQLIADRSGLVDHAAHVHLKVDTGLSRLGLLPDSAMGVAQAIRKSSSVDVAGVYTHFARAAEPDLTATQTQLKMFTGFCDDLKAAGILGFVRHAANSAALLRLPESRLDMVRAGTVLYGQYPSSQCPRVAGLSADTWQLEARTVFVHDLSPGAAVGYGAEVRVSRPTRAAVIPIGFADGLSMQPASLAQGWRGLRGAMQSIMRPARLSVRFGAFAAPVLGRIAMQMIVVDVTDAPQAVKAGDIATIPMRRLAASAEIKRIYDE